MQVRSRTLDPLQNTDRPTSSQHCATAQHLKASLQKDPYLYFLGAKGKFTPVPGKWDICVAHYNQFPDTAGCLETTNTAGEGEGEAQGVLRQLSTMPQVSRPVGQCSYSVKDGACQLVKCVPVGRRGLAGSQE